MTPADTMRAAVEALERVRCSLHQANERQDILDTLWAGPAETTFDALDYAISLLHSALEEGERYGCHCDLENTISGQPDECVFDNGDIEDCVYATMLQREGKGKTDCRYWQPIKFTASIPPNTPVEAGKVGVASGVAVPREGQQTDPRDDAEYFDRDGWRTRESAAAGFLDQERISVDRTALQAALNELRRAGKDEVAEALFGSAAAGVAPTVTFGYALKITADRGTLLVQPSSGNSIELYTPKSLQAEKAEHDRIVAARTSGVMASDEPKGGA